MHLAGDMVAGPGILLAMVGNRSGDSQLASNALAAQCNETSFQKAAA